jgi:hypothetical protein
MTAIAKPIRFSGPCGHCGRTLKNGGGVELFIDKRSSFGEWICMPCARKISVALIKAADECRELVRRGMENKNDQWVRRRTS